MSVLFLCLLFVLFAVLHLEMRSFLQLLSLAAGLSQATATPVLSRAAGAAKNLVVL